MNEKVLGFNKEKLLEDMKWTHNRLKTNMRVTSAEHELSEWITRIEEGRFDSSFRLASESVGLEALKEYRKMLSLYDKKAEFVKGQLFALKVIEKEAKK